MLGLILLSIYFFNRTVEMWNVLPLSVRQASSVSGFKMGERNYMTSRNI